LHFRLSHGAIGIPVEEFFERALPWTLPDGTKALVLAPSDLLLHLALHGGCGLGTLFHQYEILHVWKSFPREERAEAIRKAEKHGFLGVLAVADIGLRARWKTPLFTPEEMPGIRTWLHWRMNENLFNAYLEHADPLRKITIMGRIRKRWLDFQITDRPSDAIRLAAKLLRSSGFFFWNRRWRTRH
ncbi:MAG TPA: hypothetical protein VHB50_06605, partial [Bryobacteraceae bacterium]|nr:hypothetical protein [Bryobacteraceae bacterium]